jgi:quercetin dioxygenase-like cupin family protein
LRPGILISVPPSAPHSVTGAEEELLLLVAISEQVTTAQ